VNKPKRKRKLATVALRITKLGADGYTVMLSKERLPLSELASLRRDFSQMDLKDYRLEIVRYPVDN
jgi:hypothetical protein